MSDLTFAELLEDTVNLSRPNIEVESDLQVAAPTYELVQTGVAARLRLILTDIDRGLLGRFPAATAIGYLLMTDLQANDQLAQVVATTELTAAALNGADTLTVASTAGFAAGGFAQLRAADHWAEVVIAAVPDEQTLELAEPLAAGFAENDIVEAVVSYQVLGVIDESGIGHHLKAILRHREI